MICVFILSLCTDKVLTFPLTNYLCNNQCNPSHNFLLRYLQKSGQDKLFAENVSSKSKNVESGPPARIREETTYFFCEEITAKSVPYKNNTNKQIRKERSCPLSVPVHFERIEEKCIVFSETYRGPLHSKCKTYPVLRLETCRTH